ncbi:MAG: putative bifunctional diguanylate cyclase/phosphodiesterase, partial [Ilumatobacteraceae bacterium]
DVDRLPAGDGQARGSAVTERVPEVLSLLDRSTATSRAAVRADVRDAERTERLVLGVIAALELLAVWLVVRLVRSTSADVIGPLGALRDSANRLAAGEIDHRVTVERADEIGELAAAFNAMADAVAGTQRELAREASTDGLSGLANRSAFAARLDAVVARLDRRAGSQAVLFVDLDDFKGVNDRCGHGAGDELLREAAHRLERVIRPGDLVARLGGDEFALLLDDLAEPADATTIAARIVESLAEPIEVGGELLHVGASVGVAVREAGSASSQLMRQADIAMYAAKAKGKNRVEVFDAGLDAVTMTRLQLRADISSAVERGEVALAFQPIVDLRTGRVEGLEASPRWHHSTFGVVPPSTVVALAAETGAVVRLGEWILDAAARQVQLWREQYDRNDVWVSVDLGERQVEADGFVEAVTHVLEATGLPPESLVLELAEAMLTGPNAVRDSTLARLRAAGIRIALDDFGSASTSVGYLRQLPLDIIKVAPSFVADARPDSEGDGLLTAVVRLIGRLGLDVVAEGVDDGPQLERLRAMGCRLGQGDALYPLQQVAGIEALLANGSSGADIGTIGPPDRSWWSRGWAHEDEACPAVPRWGGNGHGLEVPREQR